MKRLFSLIIVAFLVLGSVTQVKAENVLGYDTSGISDSLSDEVREELSKIGADKPDINILSNLSADSFAQSLLSAAEKSLRSPLVSLAALIALMLVSSMFSSLRSSAKSSPMKTVLSVCSSLCITLTVSAPILSLIDNACSVIKTAADFSLAYLPAVAFAMSASGRAISSASYYGLCVLLGQTVSGISGNVLAPFLKALLALGITSSITDEINLRGIIDTISKISKYVIGISMTLFTSFLTLKQISAAQADRLSDRAVRFSLSSFVPVVGSALSESYKTVEASVNTLKSGVGVFAIIAVGVTFLPAVLSALFWRLSLTAGSTAAELLNLDEPRALLDALGSVVSLTIVVLLSVMSVFIIITGLAIMSGGSV